MTNYESAKDAPWYQYKDSVKHITIGDDVTKIAAHAFDGYKNVTDVTFSKDVSVIGDYAFYNCSSLKKLRLPDNNDLMEIGESAFEKCSKLEFISGYTKDAKFEPSVLVIGDRAFAGCTSIMEFKLPDDIKLGEDVFDSHSKDFAIICSELGNAFDYAKENDINVKKDFNQGIIEDVVKEEEKQKEEEKEKEKEEEKEPTKENNNETSNTKPTENNQGSSDKPSSTTQTPETQAPAQNNEDKLRDLSNKLSQATTDQEREAILKEMDKYMVN